MEESKPRSSSKRPLIIVTVVAVILIVIVGVVVWKVTKDAYEDSGPPVKSVDAENQGGNGGSTTGMPPTTTMPVYSEQELREKPWLSLRMTRDVLPVHYDITMYPDFYGDHGEFYGNETIELQVSKPTKFFLIHLHTNFVNITESRITSNETGEGIDIRTTFYYKPNEFFVIEMTQEVNEAVKLHFQFEGTLIKAIEGIYKSTYLNTDTGEMRNIAASKFEPTFARQAFPCFDEPNIKAEYTITLIHDPAYIALSNMPVDSVSTHRDGLVATKFERSVKMSTYLVCFIVCDFEYIETKSENNVPVRVYAPSDKINQGHYPLIVANHSLNMYEKLFEMDYPLPKQDLIAIPDFVSGAMEHWGLITFRESRLLFDETQASLAAQEAVAQTVAHEMAHMWFGNIVTMDWWNDLWLNEGFASYMEYVGVDDLHPTWDYVNQGLVSDLFPVMDQDSELSSHPIIVNVNRPSEITSVFDAISYSKGSSVIGMLKAIMGETKFFQGVALYLKKYKWGNAKTDDLWAALTEVSEINVKHIMDTWTLQDGFPYVEVTMTPGSTSGETTVMTKQKRFMSNPDSVVDPNNSPFSYKWYVSLNYKSSDNKTGVRSLDLDDSTFTVNFDMSKPGSWLKFNFEQHGFYRVLYPEAMWRSFSTYLNNTPYTDWELSSGDRAGLLNDAFNLAAAGLTPYDIPLSMMSYLAQEREYVPWSSALNGGILYINSMLKQDPSYGPWKKFLANKLRATINRLGFLDVGEHIERKLRPLLLNVACNIGDPTAVANIVSKFRDWLDNGTSVSVNLRLTVYRYGLMYGGTDEDWEKMWQKYLVEPSPQEKELLVDALARARQLHLVARLLEYAKEGEKIKRQDFFSVINDIGANTAATGLLWDWVRENYQGFIDRFTINDRYFGRMLYYIWGGFNTELKLQEVKEFFSKYPEAGAGERYRSMAIENIEKNIYWMQTYKPGVVSWLENNAGDA